MIRLISTRQASLNLCQVPSRRGIHPLWDANAAKVFIVVNHRKASIIITLRALLANSVEEKERREDIPKSRQQYATSWEVPSY